MSDLRRLSIQEIRRRHLEGDGPVSPQLLHRLQKDPRAGVRRIYEQLRRRWEQQREERLRRDGMLNFERVLWRSGLRHVAGVDEAGVGPLAGPVVAAAVVFPPEVELEGVDDSKRLEPERREVLAAAIREAALGAAVGQATVEEIDRLNVYHAALLAMRRAVEALPMQPEHLLIDAREIPDVPIPQNPFRKGDGIDFSIAAASIVAKVERDRLMTELDTAYPGYGFARHKGYGTAEHQEAIRRLGPCAVHRRSYTYIDELMGNYSDRYYALQEELAAASGPEELAAFERAWESRRDELAAEEQHKLRATLSRRWKSV